MSILYQIPTFCHANRSSALLERYKTYTLLIWNLHFDDQISHRNVYANNVLQIIPCFCSMQVAYWCFCWDFAFHLSNNQFHKLFKFHFGSYICCLLVNTSISVNLKILTPKPVISCGHIGWYQYNILVNIVIFALDAKNSSARPHGPEWGFHTFSQHSMENKLLGVVISCPMSSSWQVMD